MTKPEWGSKHICQSCKAKYYDFLKSPITCPKCGTVFAVDTGRKSQKIAVEAAAEEIQVTGEDQVDDLDTGTDFPDEEELVHIDDAGDVDDEDDEDLQTVNTGAGVAHHE
ncbi:hypothetical protein A9Q97_06720 [Rhodospirillales bacterium 47_12_T64]|nr:hypothetical protein A9Q97_06720 [Rhodospirillales bacterium 47_12_T64]